MAKTGKLLKTFKWTETKEQLAYLNQQQASGKFKLVYYDIVRRGNRLPIIKVYGIK